MRGAEGTASVHTPIASSQQRGPRHTRPRAPSYEEIDGRFAAVGGLGRLLNLYEQLQRELERVSYEEIDRMTAEIRDRHRGVAQDGLRAASREQPEARLRCPAAGRAAATGEGDRSSAARAAARRAECRILLASLRQPPVESAGSSRESSADAPRSRIHPSRRFYSGPRLSAAGSRPRKTHARSRSQRPTTPARTIRLPTSDPRRPSVHAALARAATLGSRGARPRRDRARARELLPQALLLGRVPAGEADRPLQRGTAVQMLTAHGRESRGVPEGHARVLPPAQARRRRACRSRRHRRAWSCSSGRSSMAGRCA